MNETPLIIGHRGACGLVPENTMASFQMALNIHRAAMVEFDVRLSRDNIPVIIHDATLERTTNGKGYVSHFTAAELGEFDAGFNFDPKKDGAFPARGGKLRIPTFEELLKGFPGHSLAVEIKEKSGGITEAVMAVVRRFKAEEKVVVGSKHEEVSKTMREKFPAVRRFLSQGEFVQNFLDFKKGKKNPGPDLMAVASMPLTACGFEFSSAEFIAYLHGRGIKTYYWTVNDPKMMRALAARKADGIITDFPNQANRVFGLNGTGPKSA